MGKTTSFPKIRLKVVGSSHTTKKHGVPQILDTLLLKLPRYKKAEHNSKGGREVSNAIIDSIIYDIDASVARDEPFVLVLCLGTNNIRKRGQAGDIMPFFERLINHVSSLQRIHIFICGLLPCPEYDNTTSFINFSQASSLLRKLCTDNPMKASFINLAEVFTTNGVIDTKFFQDGTHLSKTGKNNGAEMFAKTIFNHLQKLAKAKISYQ